jgi:ABC-type polysaccharide transport system permease subunit
VFFATFSEEEIRAIERELRAHPLADKFEFIRSERSLFEILPKGVDKGLSITKLAEYLKIDIKKTVILISFLASDFYGLIDVSYFLPNFMIVLIVSLIIIDIMYKEGDVKKKKIA